ncbi:PrsW family glutamic-type intramembrane protease [Herbiconiux flava]|uniref:PrsW family intramembrane metalloprotease n=1 Tax=Herbiconiux flava TaxID=881268 RepID=A0A852SN43_9MICO|nr:PrsW family glutamic-type intramembrane protease [Herbiconiux flava]NYD70220.1 hypothetical protein [Herbiconiux flava]
MSLRSRMLVVVVAALVAALAWLISGVVTIDLLGKERLLPLWWVAGGAIPGVALVFLVRAAVADDRRLATGSLRALAFGGAVAIALAAPLNGLLIPDGSGIWWVGLTEESSKLAAALLFSIGVGRTARSGLVLGASVGAGFAVWENAGYVFGVYADAGSAAASVTLAVQRDLVGLPLHVLFAAFVACAVFRAVRRPSAPRIAAAVAVFEVVAAAHSAYDWTQLVLPDRAVLGLALTDWVAGLLVLALVTTWVVVLRGLRRARTVEVGAVADGRR